METLPLASNTFRLLLFFTSGIPTYVHRASKLARSAAKKGDVPKSPLLQSAALVSTGRPDPTSTNHRRFASRVPPAPARAHGFGSRS
jgi:hypothetical protein